MALPWLAPIWLCCKQIGLCSGRRFKDQTLVLHLSHAFSLGMTLSAAWSVPPGRTSGANCSQHIEN